MFYIDKEFKCHTTNPNGEYRKIEKSLFQNKCNTFIEGYRYIPQGESWTREDGVVFYGEMIAPWKNYAIIEQSQNLYEELNAANIASNERIAALEEENAMLMECLLEMSEVVYA